MHATLATPKTFDSPPPISIETLVTRTEHLLSLPDAAMRLNELLTDPDAASSDIAEVVNLDPVLAARLLRVVNSASFGLRRPVDTISEAVVMIGIGELYSLVLATSAAQTFRNISSKLVDMESFWQHSVRAALVARGLAESSLGRHHERIFISALMHDVGKLVLYHQLPVISTQILEAVRAGKVRDEAEAEAAVLGFTHADVGALLLEHWNLPASLTMPVRFHHRYGDAAAFKKEAALVHLGSKVSHLMASDRAAMEPAMAMLDTTAEAWAQAGCSPSDLDEIVIDVDMHWLEVMEIIAPASMLVY